MDIIGYKCFNQDLINSYGTKFSQGKIYIAKGIIKFGILGNGFHLCTNMEDTLRYFDAMNKQVAICQVKGSGAYAEYYDEYNGYYDMFAVEQLQILKVLTRKEIIEKGLNLNDIAVKRFLAGFKLKPQEIELFKQKFQNNYGILDVIEYYQENILDAFVKRRGVYYGTNNSKRC